MAWHDKATQSHSARGRDEAGGGLRLGKKRSSSRDSFWVGAESGLCAFLFFISPSSPLPTLFHSIVPPLEAETMARLPAPRGAKIPITEMVLLYLLEREGEG